MAQAGREKEKGDLQGARAAYERVIALSPGHAGALYNLALIQVAGNDPNGAAGSLRAALKSEPGYLEARMTLGFLLSAVRGGEEAEACFREAVRRHPDHAEARFMLGIGLKERGEPGEAVMNFREAVRLNPDYAQAHFNLGDLLRNAGELDAAEAAYREAVRIDPNYLHALINLGATLHEKGEMAAASETLQKALALNPASAEAHFSLGAVFQSQRKYDEAVDSLRQAMEIDPSNKKAHFSLANCLALAGRFEESQSVRRETARLFPGDMLLRLDADIFCPGIFESTEEMDARRAQIESALDSYGSGSDSPVSLDIDLNNLDFVQLPPYFMLFHGRNERSWRCKYADLFAGNFRHKYPEYMMPVLPAGLHPESEGARPDSEGARREGPIRVGFMTTLSQEGPFLMWTRGLILNLPEEKFEISIICNPRSSETLVRGVLGEKGIEIPGLGEPENIRFIEIDGDIESTIRRIRGEKLDVLIYNELGTNLEKFILPFFRLASVQCAYWCGCTSGSAEMDYFISSDTVEPENGQDYYLEKLVRLKSPIIHFTPPPLPPEPKERGDFGFTEADHIYACPQSIHKIHPDMDKIFGGILRRDPAGQVALLEGGTPHWTEAMTRRLKKNIPDVAGRIRMLPRMAKEDFLGLLCLSDVILDPVHHNGGTTSYDSLATGTPIVTWPRNIAFGRYMNALYRKMNVMDCVSSSSEEYINIALKLGNEPSFRESVKAKIIASNHLIFKDMEFVSEMAEFLEKAVAESRGRLDRMGPP